MKKLDEIKQILTEYKPIIQKHYKVSELGIFGSYIRGEQTENSDIDILVEFSETPTLFDLVGLEDDLSDRLGIKTDLVHKKGLKPHIGEFILSEVIYL